MRTLGMLGGMSWESTAEYYRLLNRGAAARRGGLHSAPLLLHSVDFAPIAHLIQTGQWDELGRILAQAARGLEQAGAEALLMTSNTTHQVAETVAAAVSVPFLHIVDPIGAALGNAGIRRAGLLGTRYTMELPFWRRRLTERFGVELLIPESADRDAVHRIIFDELVRGRIEADSRRAYVEVIARLGAAGAEAVILGCTEIGLLLGPGDVAMPMFDTTALHVEAALDHCLDAVGSPAGA